MAIVGFVVALAVSVILGALARLVGPRLGFVDVPDDDLKPHARPVVPLGGLAVLGGLYGGLVSVDALDRALLAATLVVFVLGLVDDRYGISPLIRVIGAALAGVLLVTLSSLPTGLFFPIFWTLVTVLVVNAVNLLDGLDGLAGSVALASLGALWSFGAAQGVLGPPYYVVSIGAILGFLVWNWPRARLFLGDNGAYVLGVTLTWAAMKASPDGTASLVAVAIIGVPILELVITITRRLRGRLPLFSGDRDHVYDRLHARGMSVSLVVVMFVVAQVIWSGVVIWVAIAVSERSAIVVAVLVGLLVVGAPSLRRLPLGAD